MGYKHAGQVIASIRIGTDHCGKSSDIGVILAYNAVGPVLA
jgi:hypothetical protein